jgi:diguanylate cyclase (GGDEF)-like protein
MATTRPAPTDETRILESITDSRTGLLNEAYFNLRLEEEFKKSWRFRWTCTLLYVRIEGLAELEASEGRLAAEALLLDIAGEVLTASRDIDLAARLSGGRFAMLLPGTDAAGARSMIQRVMAAALEKVEQRVSLSVGLTESPAEDLGTCEEFVARALTALDTAHEQGCNKIVTWNTKAG